MKITGLVETYLTNNKTGKKRKISQMRNTIDSSFYAALASYLSLHNLAPNNRIVFSQLFSGGTGYGYSQEGSDGIICRIYGIGLLAAAFATTVSQPSSNQFRATGVWTNPESGSRTLIDAELGVNFLKMQGWEYPGDDCQFYDFAVAYGGLSSTVVPSGDTLTIVWTITFTVH